MDNHASNTGQDLNIHHMAALDETFTAGETRSVVKRLEFRHTHKHASQLTMADIEFSAFTRACLRGRHCDETTLPDILDDAAFRYSGFSDASGRGML